MKKTKSLYYTGLHLIVEFWKNKVDIEDPKKIEEILIQAALKAKSTPLAVKLHKFNPHGISGVCLLAESHISIHTWPEKKYIAFDIFTCGKKSMPYKALEYLKKIFQPEEVQVIEIKRGIK
jgi:S-adenosylmethionine decarboxylase